MPSPLQPWYGIHKSFLFRLPSTSLTDQTSAYLVGTKWTPVILPLEECGVSLRWKQARRVPTYPHIRPTLFWTPAYSKEIPSWSLLIPHTCQWRVLVRGRRKTKKDSQLTILSHRTMSHLLGLGQFRAIWRYLDSYPQLPFLFIFSYLDEFINSCICSQTLKFASEENGWQWLDETPILTREKSTSSS